MAKREIDLKKYGISDFRRDELTAYTRQYPELERKCTKLRWETENGKAKAKVEDGTFRDYVKANAKMLRVEWAAQIAGGEEFSKDLLRAVTQGLTYEQSGATIGRALFYQMKAAYYVNLDRFVP